MAKDHTFLLFLDPFPKDTCMVLFVHLKIPSGLLCALSIHHKNLFWARINPNFWLLCRPLLSGSHGLSAQKTKKSSASNWKSGSTVLRYLVDLCHILKGLSRSGL